MPLLFLHPQKSEHTLLAHADSPCPPDPHRQQPLDFLNLSTSFTVASPATPPPSPILASLHLPTNSSSSPKSMSLHLHLHQTRLRWFKLPVLQFWSSTTAAIVNVDSPWCRHRSEHTVADLNTSTPSSSLGSFSISSLLANNFFFFFDKFDLIENVTFTSFVCFVLILFVSSYSSLRRWWDKKKKKLHISMFLNV